MMDHLTPEPDDPKKKADILWGAALVGGVLLVCGGILLAIFLTGYGYLFGPLGLFCAGFVKSTDEKAAGKGKWVGFVFMFLAILWGAVHTFIRLHEGGK